MNIEYGYPLLTVILGCGFFALTVIYTSYKKSEVEVENMVKRCWRNRND